MSKIIKKNVYSTLKFRTQTAESFKEFLNQYSRNYSDGIDAILDFFKRTGFSPHDVVDGKISSIESTLKKRTDAIIKIIRAIEKQYFMPAQTNLEILVHNNFQLDEKQTTTKPKTTLKIRQEESKKNTVDSLETIELDVNSDTVKFDNSKLQNELDKYKKQSDKFKVELKGVLDKIERKTDAFKGKYFQLNMSQIEIDQLKRMLKT